MHVSVATDHRRLLTVQVQRRIQSCGRSLLHDRRIRAAQATCPGADPHAPQQLVSLRQVAKQAQRGGFKSMNDFAKAVRVTVKAICSAAGARQADQSSQSDCG